MSLEIKNLENENRRIVSELDNFAVLEYKRDSSVAPDNALNEYYMSEMGVRQKQVLISLDEGRKAVLQAGSMQWIAGDIVSTTGLKGPRDLFSKIFRRAATKESVIKPEYEGKGIIGLEPTFKYIILQDAASWGEGGMVVEDEMFLAADGNVNLTVASRKTVSSAFWGKEGFFNLCLRGQGIVALESNVPYEELVEVELTDDVLKIDGDYVICWSNGLQFTVERTSKTLAGSVINKERLVNVYRGTGKVLMAPLAPNTRSLEAAAHSQDLSVFGRKKKEKKV